MELPQNAGLGLRSVVAMLKMLETHSGSSAYLRQRRRMSVMLYRSLLNIKGSEKIQENVRWNLPFMTDADRQSFDKNMAEGYRRHLMAEKLILGKQAKGSAGKDKPAPPNKPAPPPKVKPPPDKLPTPLQGAGRPPQPSPKVKPPSNKLPIPLYGASRPKPPPEVKPQPKVNPQLQPQQSPKQPQPQPSSKVKLQQPQPVPPLKVKPPPQQAQLPDKSPQVMPQGVRPQTVRQDKLENNEVEERRASPQSGNIKPVEAK
jgi:hypothetical protein